MADESEPVCFVVSPIGDENSSERKKADQLLGNIVRPVLEDKGYVVTRADQIHDPGTISKQVIEHLVTADVVIADMTGHNPNVFYELAVRHAAKMPVVHMIEKGETIPFDVAPQRAIFYELALDGAEDAKTALRKMLEAIQNSDEGGESPLSNALDRIALGHAGDAGQREAALLELVQDVHLRMVNLESRNAATGLLENLARTTSGELLEYYTQMLGVFRQEISDPDRASGSARMLAETMEACSN